MEDERFFTRKKLNIIPITWFCVFVALPVCMIFFILLRVFFADNTNISNITSSFANTFSFERVLITVFTALFVASIASLLGFCLSFFVIFIRNKLRYFLFFIVIACFILNPTIHYFLFNNLLGESGAINTLLQYCNIISQPIAINSYWITLACLIYKFIPISFFICIPVIHTTRTDLVESILDLGASNIYAINNNILNKARYHLVLAFMIITVLTVGNISSYLFSLKNYSIGSYIYSNLNTNQNIIINDISLLFFVVIGILLIYLINKYFENNKTALHLSANKHLSKYKCIFIGKDWITVSVTSIVVLVYIAAILGLIFSYITLEDHSISFYANILTNSDIIYGIKNQFIVSVFATIIATILGTMLAVGYSKNVDLKKHNFFKYTILMLATSELFIIAIFWFIKTVFVFNHFTSTIIVLSTFGTVFSTIYIYNAIRQSDKNIENASLDLGANYWQTLKSVTIYSVFPAITSCFIFVFALLFNEFAITTLMSHSHSYNLFALSFNNLPQIYPISVANIIFTAFLVIIAYPYKIHPKRQLKTKLVIIILFVITATYGLFWL